MQVVVISTKQEFCFTELEEDYMDLQMMHYKRECKNCGRRVIWSALCLLCGEIVCYNNKCCEDEIIHHSKICSEGTGVFLYFSENKIILVSGNISATTSSPYKNRYGANIVLGSVKLMFEPIRLNEGALKELRENYLKDRIFHLIEELNCEFI
eukprot:TRINITY_DN11873_c0_g1_i1.p1 TRINITY_DN11873_c0_g1~~TRINITY_DN11873_c0_g1_i1.p1  ORF type:complete len:153 (-),score=21.24 TRINITY_DN11873_c0_g1_i1:30-488(-)